MRETLRAALVIARRDFTAIIFSKAFILFLIGPLFPLVIGGLVGTMGDRIDGEAMRPVIGVVLSPTEAGRLEAAHARLAEGMGDPAVPGLRRLPPGTDPHAALSIRDGGGVIAVLSGSLAAPRLTGKQGDIARLRGEVGLLAGMAQSAEATAPVRVTLEPVAASGGSERQGRLLTGRSAQVLLFLLTMLLAGMVLSNLVEEKANKIIEILAAAVPVDAIFLGKLGAMLAMSLVGIGVWATVAILAYTGLVGFNFPLPPPAVGWPLFILLFLVYFATAYTLLGSLFIGIGAQASTVREVQTLSMPITMTQVVIFFFASYAVNRMGAPPEIAAAIFPFSSPFAMIARAAQSPALWPHAAAIVWQLLWVTLIIRFGVRLFRRNVLKSGGGPARAGLFGRRRAEGV
ncbi:MAG: ABC transporter permease [Sphingobium sp.]|jgi:ABC-2 type transport system permease protein|nr:MAG: ABC transporter permease [Sphingobium sp.]